ncbi:hypothetical protein CLAIMM_13469, partial [Cladophialophora immunda]
PRPSTESFLHHRSHSSRSRADLEDPSSTLQTSIGNEKDESHRRPSYSGSDSDDFSLWSDTGDLAEQLTNNEDPYRIELDPLTREGQRLRDSGRGHGGGRKKRVGFRDQDHLERDQPPLGIDKEAIFI